MPNGAIYCTEAHNSARLGRSKLAPMSSITLFDTLAAGYESWFDTAMGRFVAERELEMILRLLQLRTGESVLEVGSGTGYFLRQLAGRGARCTGIEPSPDMLSAALKRAHEDIDYVAGCGEALPFADGRFDALLYMTTLEFVQDVSSALREAARVVRPGGRLVFGVLNAEGPWARARKREGGFWNEAHFYSSRELSALLSPLGPVGLDSCVHLPPGLSRMPVALMRPTDSVLRRLTPRSAALIGACVELGR